MGCGRPHARRAIGARTNAYSLEDRGTAAPVEYPPYALKFIGLQDFAACHTTRITITSRVAFFDLSPWEAMAQQLTSSTLHAGDQFGMRRSKASVLATIFTVTMAKWNLS